VGGVEEVHEEVFPENCEIQVRQQKKNRGGGGGGGGGLNCGTLNRKPGKKVSETRNLHAAVVQPPRV